MSHAATLAAFAEAVADATLPPPTGLVTAGGPVDAARFSVYRNNVHVGLVGALEARFPVTARIVGDDCFRALARAFVGGHKPTSPLLFSYGDDFPAFVASHPAVLELSYLADVARLETLWTAAYAAADTAPLTVADLAAVPPDRLADCQAIPHPATGWLRSPHPVATIWQRHQETIVAPFELGDGESVLVVRPDAEIVVRRIDPANAAFVDALMNGASLAAAAETAAADPGFDFGAALVGLVAAGALAALVPNP